jgi:hypothetical protein
MKVPDTVIKIKDLDLVEFMDYVQTILNRGLYEMRIFETIPNWEANDGENGIYVSGTIRQLYFMLNGVWVSIGFNSLGTLTLFDNDGDTGITPELTVDEDIIRFYASGVNNWAMGSAGFAMASDVPVLFDGLTGDTKIVYEATSQYMKLYTDGVVRQEM